MRQFITLLVFTFLLVGCFDEPIDEGGSSENGSTVSIDGNVVDGYVQNAIVFIDLDGNGLLGFGEPSTTSDEYGYYKFENIDTSKLTDRPSIVAVGGTDSTTNEKFTGKFSSIIKNTSENSEVHLSPLTTLIDTLVDEGASDEEITQAKEKIALLFDLDKDKLEKDPIKVFSSSPELYKRAISIVKVIELLNTKAGFTQNKYNFEKGMNSLKEMIDDEIKFEDVETLSISGRVIDIKDELDLISASSESLIELPEDGEGYDGDLGNIADLPSKPKLSDEEKVLLAKEKLTEELIKGLNNSLLTVVSNLNLNISPYRTKITWLSSNQDVLTNDGTVITPEAEVGAKTVELIATIVKGEASSTKTFIVKVLPKTISDSEAVQKSVDLLTFDKIKNENISISQIVSNLNLYTYDNLYNTTILWSSNNKTITYGGSVTRPTFDSEDADVTLSATVSKGSESKIVTFNLKVLKIPFTDKIAVESAYNALDVEDILGENSSKDEIIKNLDLISSGLYSTTITWTTSDELITSSGAVNRNLSLLNDRVVTLSATISKGSETLTKEFEVTVLGMRDQEILNADIQTLNFDTIKLDNQALNNIISNLNLPTSLENGSTISWSSSSQFLSEEGVVTRPDISQGYSDENVELIAYVSFNGASQNVIFNLTIKAINTALINAVEGDKEALTFDTIKDKNIQIDKISSNLTLPTTGTNGSTISWESSDIETISLTGEVQRPNNQDGSKQVTLIATISKDDISDTKEFYFTVLAKLDVNTALDFSEEVYGYEGIESNCVKTFRRNGVTYTLKLYSNLIVDESLVAIDDNIYELQGEVNGSILPSSLKLTSDYKNQEILISLYRGETIFNEDTLIESKKVVLNSETNSFTDFDLSDEDSLRIPNPTLADVEFINLPAKF